MSGQNWWDSEGREWRWHAPDTALILGAFYPGAYGPTILLEAQDLPGVVWFLRKLVELSRDAKAAFDLGSMPELRIEGVNEFKVETVAVQPDISLTRTMGPTMSPPAFCGDMTLCGGLIRRC